MKKLLLFLLIIPFVGISSLFAAPDFNIRFDDLVIPSDEPYIEKVAIEPIKVDITGVKKEVLDPRESQIIDVLQERKASLENSFVAKMNETAINEALNSYKNFREEEIRTQIDNVAEQNDVIGVLYREIEEFEISLRNDLEGYIEIKKNMWSEEYEDLEEDLNNFEEYYQEKIALRKLDLNKEDDREEDGSSSDAGIFTHVSGDGEEVVDDVEEEDDSSSDAGIFTHVSGDGEEVVDDVEEEDDPSGDAGIFTHVSGDGEEVVDDIEEKPLYDRRIVDSIINSKEGYIELYESILKKQKDVIMLLERNLKSQENSLLVQKYTKMLDLIKQDQIHLTNSLDKLLRYKESIISLAEKLRMVDYVLSGGNDREVLSGYEEYVLMESKELLSLKERYAAAMRQSLDTYQMEQVEAQEIVKYSIENLNNINLK